MAKRILFSDLLLDHLATATESDLHALSSQVAMAIRLRFGNAALKVQVPSKRTRRTKQTGTSPERQR